VDRPRPFDRTHTNLWSRSSPKVNTLPAWSAWWDIGCSFGGPYSVRERPRNASTKNTTAKTTTMASSIQIGKE
jgi:hypothetical protein